MKIVKIIKVNQKEKKYMNKLKERLTELNIENYRIWDKEKVEEKLKENTKTLSDAIICSSYSIFVHYISDKTGYDGDYLIFKLSELKENNWVKCFDEFELVAGIIINGFYIMENIILVEICDRENVDLKIYFWIEGVWK